MYENLTARDEIGMSVADWICIIVIAFLLVCCVLAYRTGYDRGKLSGIKTTNNIWIHELEKRKVLTVNTKGGIHFIK